MTQTVKRRTTPHGRERYLQRVGYATQKEILHRINSMPPGERVVCKGFVYIFATDQEDESRQVLITVKPERQ